MSVEKLFEIFTFTYDYKTLFKSNEQTKKEFKETILFTITIKTMEYRYFSTYDRVTS